ncbi:MAG: DoxX family protein [Bacteroidales bacterium]|jgi:putative oxidoreductase|nr:DoxX family protein [Bacteroidales bacterium]MDD4702783.1 DoxX family protein [Bacteroidales bacterium]
MKLIKALIGNSNDDNKFSWGILLLRIFLSALMLTHGFAKLNNFETLSTQFPDILGIGGEWNLILVILAEFGCSLLIIFGLFTRLSTLPIIFSMIIAAFVAHANDPFAAKEMAVLYLGLFTYILYAGAGKFSLDYLIRKWFSKQ